MRQLSCNCRVRRITYRRRAGPQAGSTADALCGAEVCVLAEYFPVLLFMVVSAGIGIALIAIGNLLGPRKPSAEKDSPYECGFEAFEDARMKFDVRYYLIAILFIIFD